MRICVTSNGAHLDAPISPVFGRCPYFIFVDPERMDFEAVDNPALSAGGGAGIQAAQFVIERNARAVVTGQVGPNAFQVFQAAQVPVYVFKDAEGTVRQAVEAYREGKLSAANAASVPAHAGMRRAGRQPSS